jgi:hypothetical protein
MPSFPASIKSFTTKNAGDTIQPADVNDLQDEVNALEAGYLNGTARLNSSNSTCVSLVVTGAASAATLDVSATSTLHGNVTMSADAAVTGNLTVLGGVLSAGHLLMRESVYTQGSTTITPSTGTINDMVISSAVANIRMNVAAGGSTVTGFALAGGATDGQMLWIWNVGTGSLGLSHTTGSASTGQFACPNNATATVRTNGAVLVRYDATAGFWRVLGL